MRELEERKRKKQVNEYKRQLRRGKHFNEDPRSGKNKENQYY